MFIPYSMIGALVGQTTSARGAFPPQVFSPPVRPTDTSTPSGRSFPPAVLAALRRRLSDAARTGNLGELVRLGALFESYSIPRTASTSVGALTVPTYSPGQPLRLHKSVLQAAGQYVPAVPNPVFVFHVVRDLGSRVLADLVATSDGDTTSPFEGGRYTLLKNVVTNGLAKKVDAADYRAMGAYYRAHGDLAKAQKYERAGGLPPTSGFPPAIIAALQSRLLSAQASGNIEEVNRLLGIFAQHGLAIRSGI